MSLRPAPASPVSDRELFDATSDALFIHDGQGRIVDVNQRTCELLGYTREELCQLTVGDFSLNEPPYTQEEAARRIRKAAEEGTQTFEWVCRAKDGATFPVEVSLRTTELGGQAFVVAACRDISDRKRAERTLRDEKERLRGLMENLYQIGIYQGRVGADGVFRFLYISPGLAALHGVEVESALTDPEVLYAQLHPDDAGPFREAEARAIAAQRPFLYETRFVVADGEVRHSLIRARPRRQEDGSVLWDGAEIDITAQRRAEEENARLEEGLRQAQKMESIGRLAGGIAHDFNNFLTAIAGNSSLLRLGLEDPDSLELLDELDQVTHSAARLTRELLTFSRKEMVHPRRFELDAMLSERIPMLRRILGDAIALDFRPGSRLGTVSMDPGQAERVLANLAANAREAMPSGGHLSIATEDVKLTGEEARAKGVEPGAYVRLVIADDGVGMSEEVKARMFEPFFTTREAGRGTGLGLAMVYGAIGRAGGCISVDSAPGVGTTFSIDLPYAGAVETSPAVDRPAAPRGSGETILYVEDEIRVRNITAEILRRAGYQVRVFGDPRLALQDASPATLLITDVVMPGMGGRELAEALVAQHDIRKTLFTSGFTEDSTLLHGVAHDEVDFLPKPYTADELLARVREVLDRP